MKALMLKVVDRFKETDHVITKTVGAFCIAMIPVITSINFTNPVWNDCKSVAYIVLSAIAFFANFSKQTNNK